MLFFILGKDFSGGVIKVELAEKFVPKKMRERGGGGGRGMIRAYRRFYKSYLNQSLNDEKKSSGIVRAQELPDTILNFRV